MHSYMLEKISKIFDFLKIIDILNNSNFDKFLDKNQNKIYFKIIYIKYIYISSFILKQNFFQNDFKKKKNSLKIKNKINIKEKLIFLKQVIKKKIVNKKYKKYKSFDKVRIKNLV
jgi:hypothetical protein